MSQHSTRDTGHAENGGGPKPGYGAQRAPERKVRRGTQRVPRRPVKWLAIVATKRAGESRALRRGLRKLGTLFYVETDTKSAHSLCKDSHALTW